MAYLYPNLLFGSWDLSTALWFGKATRSDKTFWGAAVADCNTGVADARATSGAEYVLSFFARADVAGDKIHSDVWGSKYMLDTELTTEWQQVVMPYGIVNAYHREIFIYGLRGAPDVRARHRARRVGARRWRDAGRGGCSHER